MAIDFESRDYFVKTVNALKLERQGMDGLYRELQTRIKPMTGRFFQERGQMQQTARRYNDIIDSSATTSWQTARAGLLAGVMSPARPWFKLTTPDPAMMEFPAVKVWLDQVEKMMFHVFNTSNLYDIAPVMIGELLIYGTGVMLHVDDAETLARFYSVTTGSYYLAQNDKRIVDTVVREYDMTALNLVRKFGRKNLSPRVLTAYDRSNYYSKFPVVHVIEPNPSFDPNKIFARFKSYRSVYYEPGNMMDKNKFLDKSGFQEFPAYGLRWDVLDEDVYGSDCPGISALGDIKGLQIEQKRKAQAIDKHVNPPLDGPSSLAGKQISSLPGGVTLYSAEGNRTLKPIYQVQPNLGELRLDMDEVKSRIQGNFFVDLFLAISNMQGIQPKNQLELAQRNEERLLMLGPVLQKFHKDFLQPLIKRTFNQLTERRILPPTPPELDQVPLRVEFVSTLAIAQRAVATGAIERVTAFAGNLAAQGWTRALKKIDAGEAVDAYATIVGAPPRMIVSDEDVLAQEEAEAEAAEQQRVLENAQTGMNVAKTAGDTSLEDENLVSEALAG